MNYFSSFLLVFISVLSVLSSNIVESLENQEIQFIRSGLNHFSVNFYKTLARKEKGNFVCSPISAHILGVMTIYGTDSFRKLELSNPSNISESEILLLQSYSQWFTNLKNAPNTEFSTANRLYIHNEFPTNSFEKLTEIFRSKIKIVNFKDTFRTTRNDLKDMELAMVSTGFFKGDWLYPFNYLQNRIFNVSKTEDVVVVVMCDTAPYNYGSIPHIDAKYIELPYGLDERNNLFSMYIIMPNDIDGLDAITEKLHEIDFATLNAPKRIVDVYIPKFKIETKLGFGAGMSDHFYNRIYQRYLKISAVIQKSFINVDVKGSESAYATFLEITLVKEPTEINVDRPFIAVIVSKVESIPLMWARITNPLE
ncbi:hypothetical protein PV327_007613 [Microctonus hyperodae]|uniref:Serpin domain-containing protein n=1 Tax=Microctonus hyperodae TaxID=165561 RepID=A0AA39KYT7_MICHY|nr:hypothetical protein PV327_007613 [Microctonus hyperodae]